MLEKKSFAKSAQFSMNLTIAASASDLSPTDFLTSREPKAHMNELSNNILLHILDIIVSTAHIIIASQLLTSTHSYCRSSNADLNEFITCLHAADDISH